jgi:hypothetical protein
LPLPRPEKLRGFGIISKIDATIVVFINSWHGSQFCPFPSPPGYKHRESSWTKDCPVGSSIDCAVYNLEQKDYVCFSGLHSHLIKDHHFFEGHTAYRVQPDRLIRVLEISPAKNYILDFITIYRWIQTSTVSGYQNYEEKYHNNTAWEILDEKFGLFFSKETKEKKKHEDGSEDHYTEIYFKCMKPCREWRKQKYKIEDTELEVNLSCDFSTFSRHGYRQYLF